MDCLQIQTEGFCLGALGARGFSRQQEEWITEMLLRFILFFFFYFQPLNVMEHVGIQKVVSFYENFKQRLDLFIMEEIYRETCVIK